MAKQKVCCLQFFCLIFTGLFALETYALSGIVRDIIYESFDESFEKSWLVSKTEDYLAKSKDIGKTKSKGTTKKPRFLCLHGRGSNAKLLKDHFNNWPDFVLEKMDFVYINGPFSVDDGTSANEVFVWFTRDKGAVVAGALPGMQAHGACLTKVGKIEHAILISGAKLGGRALPLPKLAETAFSSPINISSLHIFGETDFARANAPELVEAYVDPLVIFHHGGHEVPKLDEDGLKIMFEFLKKINAIV